MLKKLFFFLIHVSFSHPIYDLDNNRQRRREVDFQRTVGNYRESIALLKKEKETLLTEIGGCDHVKNDAIVASQRALAQALQSVSDAAAARKNEAESSLRLIDGQIKSHLADRLEMFLPDDVACTTTQ